MFLFGHRKLFYMFVLWQTIPNELWFADVQTGLWDTDISILNINAVEISWFTIIHYEEAHEFFWFWSRGKQGLPGCNSIHQKMERSRTKSVHLLLWKRGGTETSVWILRRRRCFRCKYHLLSHRVFNTNQQIEWTFHFLIFIGFIVVVLIG